MREIERQITHEDLTSKEVLRTYFGGITISGKSGTGKTTTMEILADLYGIERLYKGGQTMRGATDVHAAERAQKLDRDLDRKQAEFIKSADPDNPFLDEGRLAGFLATQELAKNPDLNVVRVLFVASLNVRVQRLLGRRIEEAGEKLREIMDRLDEAYQGQADPAEVHSLLEKLVKIQEKQYTFTSVKDEEQERERNDDVQWKNVHPALEEIGDIFHPSLARVVITPGKDVVINKKGPKFYDFAVNTSYISVEETARVINEQLIKMGKVERVSP